MAADLVIGMDVGSTTVKAVVVHPDTRVPLWHDYQRHQTRQPETVLAFLERIVEAFPEQPIERWRLFLTGSGASPLCDPSGGLFVQEVNAVTLAVEQLHPDVLSVVELGGQDAKIIFFKEDRTTGQKTATASMNDKCASGTGATIDKCLIKVGAEPGFAAALRFDSRALHHVAAKCGVFAETDIVNLVKAGIPKGEVLNSLADAIVLQNLSVLTRGSTLRPKVLLLGGPNTYLPFLQDCWRTRIPETWRERGIDVPRDVPIDDLIFVPPHAELYAALGAACYGLAQPDDAGRLRDLGSLRAFITNGRRERLGDQAGPPLSASAEETRRFVEQYRIPRFVPPRVEPGATLRAVIGLDGGSEYRKALRDAGFEGFRVVLFQQSGGLRQATGADSGLELTPRFFFAILKALLAGDILNAIGYRLRPYEIERGATDDALTEAKRLCRQALLHRPSILRALWKARRLFARVRIDRTVLKPKVAIIGEFWAMTTEGDGNYHMQRFIEREGGEVDSQLLVAWLLYNIWQVRFDTAARVGLRGADDARRGLARLGEYGVVKRRVLLWAAERALRGSFGLFARAAGLDGHRLPDMREIAEVAAPYYNNDLRGGEGHMEVGKLIMNVVHAKATMTVSVKPFGCMPSSGVSDGVQSLIAERHPGTIFCAVETSGDGAVNFQSRIQLFLFKAKQAAARELEQALAATGLTMDAVQRRLARHRRLRSPLHHPAHRASTTTADMVYAVAGRTGRGK